MDERQPLQNSDSSELESSDESDPYSSDSDSDSEYYSGSEPEPMSDSNDSDSDTDWEPEKNKKKKKRAGPKSKSNAFGSEQPPIIQRALAKAADALEKGRVPEHAEYYSSSDEDPDDPMLPPEQRREKDIEINRKDVFPVPDFSNMPGKAWPKPPVMVDPTDPELKTKITYPPSVQWREEPYRTPREEPFTPIIKPGLNPDNIKPHYSPAQICMNLLTVPFALMLEFTNKAGKAWHGGKWKEITMGEFTRWFACYLSMTILFKSNYREYWNLSDKATLTTGVRRCISRNRFNIILQFLRASDPDDPVQKRGTPQYDRLGKIRPIWDVFWEACRAVRGPDRIISMDESMAKFYGKFSGRMTIPNKPNPVGIRMWSLNDPETGYCYAATVYVPRNPANEVETALTDWFGGTFGAVWNLLLSGSGFFNQGYYIIHDNYYTMMRLMKQLLDAGVYTLGTVCHTRQFPEELIGKKKLKNELERGDMIFLHAENGLTIVVWKDNAIVTMAYTIPNIVEQQTMATRRTKTSKATGLYLVKIKQPLAVKFYNTYMAGTDRFDQHTGVLNRSSRHSKWPLVLIKYILNTAAYHTWVLKRDLMSQQDKMKYYLRHCVATTVEGLLSFAVAEGHIYRPRIVFNAPKDLGSVMGGHWPTKGKRGYCHLHGKARRIHWRCEKCDINLCVTPCLKIFHTSANTREAKKQLLQLENQ